MTPGTTIPEGSPSLDEKLRSKERAALDIAVKALREVTVFGDYKARLGAVEALDKIAVLVPDAMSLSRDTPDPHGEDYRNTGWKPNRGEPQ